ncbi:MAG: ATP-dependent sacrificial sulfur transferase LarE [Ignisphaera sp.]
MISLQRIGVSSLAQSLNEVIKRLTDWFRGVEKPIIVSFSGGTDSSAVLAIACKAVEPYNVVAVTALSPIRLEEDLNWAKRITSTFGVKHIIVETNELSDPNFEVNLPNRCYICKKYLISKLLEVARKLNAKTIVDGTNASDLSSYRPGIQALKEAGVRSPLAELGISKDEVKLIAKAIGLPNWDRPSATCLATRIPYGESITLEKLKRIAEAEEVVKRLLGVKTIRVRDHGYIARIEVDPRDRNKFFSEEIMDLVAMELKRIGYKYVTLDLLGYRSGSLDELLKT